MTGALDGSGTPLSPGNADDMKAANLAFDGWFQTIQGRPADEQASLVAEWVGRAGVLPEAVETSIRGGARGTPDQVLAAADMLGRIEDRNPALASGLDGGDYTYLRTVQSYVERGVEGKRAVDLATTNVLDAGEAEQKERSDRWGKEKLGDTARSYLQDQASGGGVVGWVLSAGEALPDALQGEFTDLAHDYFLETGDAAIANDMAWKDIQGIWGKTSVGSTGWMRYPPERVYGQGESDGGWMNEQLQQDIRDQGLAVTGAPLGIPITTDPETRLVPAPTTGRQAQPGYYTEILNADGVWELLLDKETGKPLVWRPDYATSPAANKAKTDAVDAITQGREEHQNRINIDERMGTQSPLDSFVPPGMQ